MASHPQDATPKNEFDVAKKDANEVDKLKATESFSKANEEEKTRNEKIVIKEAVAAASLPKKKPQAVTIARLRSVLTVFSKNRLHLPFGLGPRVVGTIFGHRRGHVHVSFQKDAESPPAFLIELATPISGLVREMASGLVRIALECDKEDKKAMRLLEEPVWRTFCNGKKCGFAAKRECGPKDRKVLKALEPVSMGAGVLPANDANPDDEIMYMRAKFERIVGSRDSEAFYMMNPDCNGAPELSIYLLRV